jgi:hypothetical protein
MSGTTTPTPFTPTGSARPDSQTTAHLLSLPPLLSPISPSLAALHMARMRLLLDVPASPGVGQMTEWWCHACGGLREGLAGASSKRRGRPKGGQAKSTTGPTTKQRKGKGKRSSKASPTASATADDMGPVKTIQRRPAECSNCGAKFRKARPDRTSLITYPSARIAARRKQEQAAMDIDDPFTTSGTAPAEPVVEQTTATPPPTVNRAPPSFSRVKDTEPNLPTYPSPQPSSPPDKGKKRKKKSGLAKLLAENKERAAAQNLGGSWGLG